MKFNFILLAALWSGCHTRKAIQYVHVQMQGYQLSLPADYTHESSQNGDEKFLVIGEQWIRYNINGFGKTLPGEQYPTLKKNVVGGVTERVAVFERAEGYVYYYLLKDTVTKYPGILEEDTLFRMTTFESSVVSGRDTEMMHRIFMSIREAKH